VVYLSRENGADASHTKKRQAHKYLRLSELKQRDAEKQSKAYVRNKAKNSNQHVFARFSTTTKLRNPAKTIATPVPKNHIASISNVL
jgi:hypothetical protein